MKTIEELRAFYAQTMMPDLQALETRRRQVVFRVIRNGAMVLAGVVVLGLSLWPVFGGNPDVLLMIAFAAVGGAAAVYWMGTRAYTSEFKQRVIARLVEFIEPGLVYRPDARIPQGVYEQSRLFPHQVDVYRGDDLVQGRIGQTGIQFSELHTQYITRDSKGRTSRHTIFRGLFFAGDFNKHFYGRTVVLPDRAERLLGGLGRFLQSKNVSRDELVKMDDPEFEKEFVVYATDQIEARYILTSSLMRRLLDFRNKTGKPIAAAFVNSSVFIAVSYTQNLFEPKIFETLLNIAPIEEYFADLNAALGIVEDLNLNIRIWSKE